MTRREYTAPTWELPEPQTDPYLQTLYLGELLAYSEHDHDSLKEAALELLRRAILRHNKRNRRRYRQYLKDHERRGAG